MNPFTISTFVSLSLLITPAAVACDDATPQVATPSAQVPPVKEVRPIVELAICLDISGSMDGLIDSAKARLWSIVNDLATAKPVPELRVALLTFGCDAYDPMTGWVVVDSGLTEDLDLISQKLFALRTNGGTELVGRVVSSATKSLEWSTDPNSLRIIIVAGNEGADQDTLVTYQDASRASIEKGILVNSIYCGNPADPIAAAWGDVAKLADGQFFCIDQSMGAAVAATPFDAELGILSTRINTTYLPLGSDGRARLANQSLQDENAAGLGGGVAAQRCMSKGSEIYDNRAWDLVDGCSAGEMKLEDLKDAELPEEFRGKTLEQKKALVAAKQAERSTIQAEIQQIQVKREAFLNEAAMKRAATEGVALDDALKQAIRCQAEKKGMQFPKAKPVVAPIGVLSPDASAVQDPAKKGC